jgi:hypothetical protein
MPIDIVTDHKNLKYFCTTKVLTHQQAHWSEFLSQFNLVIQFCPGHLRTKPDLMLSLDDGMSTQKGGIMATLQSICRIFAQSLHKNSYPPLSMPLISLFHPSAQPQSWI